jgi:DNA polymerase III epsilon subunit-like protein
VQYTIFDIETTGLDPGSDAVIQLAFITVNQELFPLRSRNYYLYKRGMPWSKEAAAVHKLTQEFLQQYEADYERNLLNIYCALQRGSLVGHNSNSFDIPFTSQFLVREGLPRLSPDNSYDTMKIWQPKFGKRMKLGNLVKELGIEEESVTQLASVLFNESPEKLASHNACYDATATLLCWREALRAIKPKTPVNPDVAAALL